VSYEIGKYYDQDTQRERWAVFAKASRTWVLPERYGKKAAEKLAKHLNKHAS